MFTSLKPSIRPVLTAENFSIIKYSPQKKHFTHQIKEPKQNYLTKRYNTSKLTALIIDDSPTIQLMHSAFLQKLGFEVRILDNGNALKSTAIESFDLILLDVNLLGQSGISICQQIRNTPLPKQVPIVFITTDDSQETKQQCLAAGGNALLTKPVSIKQLASTIKDLLKQSPHENSSSN